MGLFDQIVSAIDNPNQQANPSQLGSIINTVQQLSNNQGVDSSQTQTLLSTVGGYVRSALQQQQAAGGRSNAEAIVNQYSGTSPNAAAVQALFSPAQQQQVAQAISQKTGINAETILAMLPTLIPIVLQLLQSGANKQGSQASGGGSNSVLSTFLDSDGDRDVDIGDAISLASRFLNRR
ncbi:DUF937 domain-containing protein [Cyanobacteria bacterium FACHB-471]|nr:DUF937 domain-containing protein [Cyanobacteria bacterium FACHB-471]